MEKTTRAILDQADRRLVMEFDMSLVNRDEDYTIRYLRRQKEMVKKIIDEHISDLENKPNIDFIQFQNAVYELENLANQLDAFFAKRIDEYIAGELVNLNL